jgi:hypothetical protein
VHVEEIGDAMSGDGMTGRRLLVDDQSAVAIDLEQRLQEPGCKEVTLGSKRRTTH